ncbi:MAG TPA: TFIIB-type zinc ribbon-containing protein [Nitrososphaeraceae archaeon]|jgi:transcription initiation factor TFIIB
MAKYPNLISEFNNNNDYKTNKRDSSINPHLQKCSSCKSSQIITDIESGEIVCSNCGQVISNNALEDNRPEWRSFGAEEQANKIRTGIPTSLARHDMGLATVIGTPDRDASGHKIDAAMRSMMERLRTWDARTQAHSSTDRNLRHAFYELDRLKDKLGLSDTIVEKSAYIYRKAQERMLIRGRTISGILAAAIYIACRELGTPRTLKDIAADSAIKLKEVARSYRILYFELDLKMPLVDPMKCIVKVANKAKLSEKTKRQAAEMMRMVNKRELSAGKDPMGLAASVLYLASLRNGDGITQMDIADAAGVTEVTLRNRTKDLRNNFLN